MWWNEKDRRWEKHPDCRCDHDPCYCVGLRPLDAQGRPIDFPMVEALGPKRKPAKKRSAA